MGWISGEPNELVMEDLDNGAPHTFTKSVRSMGLATEFFAFDDTLSKIEIIVKDNGAERVKLQIFPNTQPVVMCNGGALFTFDNTTFTDNMFYGSWYAV